MRPEKLVKKEVGNIEKDVINDLCITCNHYQICSTRRDRGRPIWFCEEFDDYLPVKEMELETDYKASFKKVKKEAQQFKGLCVNCENRKTCKLLKPNGGIWHCEEYI
jgi:hypothetical protein